MIATQAINTITPEEYAAVVLNREAPLIGLSDNHKPIMIGNLIIGTRRAIGGTIYLYHINTNTARLEYWKALSNHIERGQ